jgi:hypothetical protein
MKNFVANSSLFRHQKREQGGQSFTRSSLSLLLYAIAFLFCIIISITPLNRLGTLKEIQSWPGSTLFLALGSWLPVDLKLASIARDSQISTHLLWLLLFIALEFIIYALAAWCIRQQCDDYDNRRTLTIIWLGVLAAGLIFVFTPALLSRDLFVYAGYGRVLAHYHANPYFVTLSAYPRDTLVALDDWNTALCAYGPVWLLICALSSWLAGEHIVVYVFFYRMLGFAAHALNILLISRILLTMGKTPRTVALGSMLYAWNPLVLQESCLGGHNDTFMVTFLLIGLLYSVRAEQQKSFTALRAYLPSLTAFTLAVLIKFTSAPLLALFLVLLACKFLQSKGRTRILSLKMVQQLEWRALLQAICPACLVSMGIILAFYAPFWAGHSVHDILASFSSPPSARSAYGSILGALLNWEKAVGGRYTGWAAPLLLLFSQHQTWQDISTGVAALLLLIGVVWLWCIPTTRTLALSALAVLGGVLIVTPWFFPWYVIWLVGLAVVCLPLADERVGRALLGFTLAFSASAHFIYIFRGYQPIGDWIGWIGFTTIGPPLIILLLLLLI